MNFKKMGFRLPALLGALALGVGFGPGRAEATEDVEIISIQDSINPGTADYVLSALQAAEKDKRPFLILQLDTPGGLLSTTRRIVQAMLNAKIPVVVFIGPRGARAGSAGALITLAADVAAMAPGTNVGAAHPVGGGGEEIADKPSEQKIVNDTVAFAQSLARAHAKNVEWAAKAVKDSAAIDAETALKQNVIDLIADDTQALVEKLQNFRLKMPKAGMTQLPARVGTRPRPMNLKQRAVAFFADPNLAYLILSLGGLCLWIELSHPGALFPGVLGLLCILVSLVSFQMLPIRYGALAMIWIGMALIVAELYLPTFGILGLGGLAAFIVGSLFLMDTAVPEFQLSLTLILPTAAVLAGAAFLLGTLVFKSRRLKPRSGLEALVGEFGEMREGFEGAKSKPGKVFVHGELWNAVSADAEEISKGALVVITEVRGLLLIVNTAKTLS